MKIILLTKDKFTLIDDDDFERVNKYNWYYIQSKKGFGYAIRNLPREKVNGKKIQRKIYLHRFLMNCEKGLDIDHIDFDTLNNQKSNLRKVTRSQNTHHTKISVRGIDYYKSTKKWFARLKVNGEMIFGKQRKHREKAIEDYKKMLIKYCGEFGEIKSNHILKEI